MVSEELIKRILEEIKRDPDKWGFYTKEELQKILSDEIQKEEQSEDYYEELDDYEVWCILQNIKKK